MTSYFVLIAADTEALDGRKILATELAVARLNRKMWSLFRRTKNRLQIRSGDRLLFYVAGEAKKGGGRFIASATVGEISEVTKRTPNNEAHLLIDNPTTVLELTHVESFKTLPAIREIRHTLAFIPDKRGWGAVLQGGCCRIGEADFNAVRTCAGLK